MSMLRSKIPPLRVTRLSKRSQYLFSETLVLMFGLTACEVVLSKPGNMHWSLVVPCVLGYVAAFSLMLTTRCERCDEPLGRDGKRLVAVPHTHCTKCGHSVG